MITWIVAVGAIAIVCAGIITAEIRDAAAVRRYQRQREQRLRLFVEDLHRR